MSDRSAIGDSDIEPDYDVPEDDEAEPDDAGHDEPS